MEILKLIPLWRGSLEIYTGTLGTLYYNL